MYKCKYCGHIGPRHDFEFDHNIPVSRSFLGQLLQPVLDYICSGCNRQKGTMTGYEYSLWRLLNPNKANYGSINH
jgi:5-methylcytosine-specific restriction endonuclease McrA